MEIANHYDHGSMMRLAAFILAITLLPLREGVAQCCSAGSPVGGTYNVGIVNENILRTLVLFRNESAGGYYAGSNKSSFTFIKHADYNYVSTVLTYGISSRLNAETELGYFFNRTQVYDESIIPAPNNVVTGSGLSDAVISLKYNAYRSLPKEVEFTIGLGAKIPFYSQYESKNGIELPLDVQPSTTAYGIVAQAFLYKGFIEDGWRVFLLNRFEASFPNSQHYKYGNAYLTSLFVSHSLNEAWTAVAQIRNEIRDEDTRYDGTDGAHRVTSSGGVLFFFTPQINYTIDEAWNISLLADIPIYKYYNGTQLGNQFGFAFTVIRDFDLSGRGL